MCPRLHPEPDLPRARGTPPCTQCRNLSTRCRERCRPRLRPTTSTCSGRLTTLMTSIPSELRTRSIIRPRAPAAAVLTTARLPADLVMLEESEGRHWIDHRHRPRLQRHLSTERQGQSLGHHHVFGPCPALGRGDECHPPPVEITAHRPSDPRQPPCPNPRDPVGWVAQVSERNCRR